MSPVMTSDASWKSPMRAAFSASRWRPWRTFASVARACAITATSSECSERLSDRELRMRAQRSM